MFIKVHGCISGAIGLPFGNCTDLPVGLHWYGFGHLKAGLDYGLNGGPHKYIT